MGSHMWDIKIGSFETYLKVALTREMDERVED
jgi:hypothetical protein